MSQGHEQDSAYAACVTAAVEYGARAAPRLVHGAGELMARRAAALRDEADRQAESEAGRFLKLREELFVAAWPMCLQTEFASSQPEENRATQGLSFESLELMQEDQVDETVEVVRGQQLVLSEVEADLAALNSLISAARGRKVVSASDNPFLPDAWVRALRSATQECRVPPAIRARWLHSLCETLGPELARCYRELADLLRRRGITAASFAVSATGATAAPVPAPARPTPAPAAARPQAAPPVPVLNLRDLRRLLTGEGEPRQPWRQPEGGKDDVATQDHALTVPWAYEALQEMKGVDQVMQRMRERRAADAGTVTPAQALSQEVVRVMVENITRDLRLPAPVRQAVLELEPALLRLAQSDPRFFRDKDHPTRRFLAETTERSLAWPSPDQPGFARFFKPVREAVDALGTVLVDSGEPFELALQSMHEAWAQEEARSREHRARAAQALIRAEKRNLLALGIADELRARADVVAAPAEVRRFVTGPWSQVIAAARMREDGAADAQAYEALVNDLIWSTQPRLAAENRVRLARLVPPLLATLRRGLVSIEYGAAGMQRFFEYLADLHQMALRPPTASAPVPIARAELDAQLDRQTEEVWLEPAEARDSGLMDFASLRPLTSQSAPPLGANAGAAAGAAPSNLESLKAGMWVDLLLDGAWSRWRLAWVSSHSLLFMFTDGSGGSRSMTRGTLEQLIAQGGVRVVAAQPVLDEALDAVATQALRNTMDTTL